MNEKEIDKRTEAAEFRYGIGADILLAMNRNHDLPLPNKHRLAKVMQEYYKRDGYEDRIREMGWRWKASVSYWDGHLDDVRRVLRDKGRPFECVPDREGSILGQWKFPDEKEEDRRLRQKYNDIATRTDSFNEERDGASKKWPSLPIPTIKGVPLLN
jgi:hypothetical protein